MPGTASNHIRARQVRQIERGSAPWMPRFVMNAMATDMASPIVQAKRLGFVDTHCGG